MSVNAQFASMHTALFNRLADPCTVKRGAAAPVDSRCIVAEGVQRIGQHGQVIGLVTKVSFLKAEWSPQRADVVTLDGVGRKVEAIDTDDGIVVEAVLNG